MKQINENNGISRRESIYELLKEHTTVNVKDLSKKFGVS
ncbi:DeoR family transcriptional regulator, partial [Pseudobutyrivibrio sp.]